MAPPFLPILIAVFSLGFIIIGTQGIRCGQRISKEKGPHSLMHYPAPLPWLRNKVTTARWVTWIGRLYLAAGLVGMTGAGVVLSGPADQKPNANCSQLAATAMSAFPRALQGGRVQHSDPDRRCVATIFDQQNVRWFEISSATSAYAPKHDFLESRRTLSRLAYSIQPIEGLGTRAALARPKPGSSLNPILLLHSPAGQYRIEINGRKVGQPQLEQFIEHLRETLRTQRHQSL